MKNFVNTEDQIGRVVSSVEELVSANSETNKNVEEIHLLNEKNADTIRQSKSFMESLIDETDSMIEMVADFKTGQGLFEFLLEKLSTGRERCIKLFEDASNKGVNIFDENYRKMEGNFDPPKYTTSYDKILEKTLQIIYDDTLKDIEGAVFCLCVDKNGYAPTHNSKYCKDLNKGRDKRIFNDKTGLRSARSTKSYLFQTYERDNGEILSELSMPIYIHSKHWGAIRLGLNPDIILKTNIKQKL
jgi:methyl-accepting chemotaxis protein